MSRVVRRDQRYDDEIAKLGHRRLYRSDWAVTDNGVVPVYREITMPIDSAQFDWIPWWKRIKTRRKKS